MPLTQVPSAMMQVGGVPSFDGIKFPASQVTSADANTLDDYEEGAWTPVVTPSTGSLTSYTSVGKYTKIGRVVTVDLYYTITTPGTASGVPVVSGFPFAAASGTGLSAAFLVREDNGTGVAYQGLMRPTQTYINVFTTANNPPPWTSGYGYSTSFSYLAA